MSDIGTTDEIEGRGWFFWMDDARSERSRIFPTPELAREAGERFKAAIAKSALAAQAALAAERQARDEQDGGGGGGGGGAPMPRGKGPDDDGPDGPKGGGKGGPSGAARARFAASQGNGMG